MRYGLDSRCVEKLRHSSFQRTKNFYKILISGHYPAENRPIVASDRSWPEIGQKWPEMSGFVVESCNTPEKVLNSREIAKFGFLTLILVEKGSKIAFFCEILIFVEISESVEVSTGSEISTDSKSRRSEVFKSGLRFFISHFVRFLMLQGHFPLLFFAHASGKLQVCLGVL